jgi:hypothetical protein
MIETPAVLTPNNAKKKILITVTFCITLHTSLNLLYKYIPVFDFVSRFRILLLHVIFRLKCVGVTTLLLL